MIVNQEIVDRLKMANGIKPILKVGDYVRCIDTRSKRYDFDPVTEATSFQDEDAPNKYLAKDKIYQVFAVAQDEIQIDSGTFWNKTRFTKVCLNDIEFLMYKIGYEILGS